MKAINFAAIALACALTACGGGGNSGGSKADIATVKVAGASLADSGTFGYKFTVQPSSTYPLVYSERIAATYGASKLCPKFLFNGTTFVANPTAGCTNYAVAGASVGNYSLDYHLVVDATSPTSALRQMAVMGAAGFAANNKDLVIVGEAPANDVATLASAYLGTNAPPANASDFPAMMTAQMAAMGLNGTQLTSMLGSGTTRGQLGGLYMQAMADQLTASIQSNLLDNGATRVVVLNCLDVTLTPKFKRVLAGLNLADPTGAMATAYQGMVRAWVQAFNARLAANVAALGSKVVLVDFYSSFSAEMSDPGQYSLSNVDNTVCDEVLNNGTTTSVVTAGTTALSTPSTVGACTVSAASAITPHQNATGTDWWKTYLFADNFHPTPYGHQLLAQLVAKRLTEAGWL